MKKLLWTSAMALAAVACLTACDDSSSGSSNSGIPEYKMVANLPDSCEMEVAKVDTAYFACFENKWIEVTDSATIEQFKDGMDESKIKEKLEELENQLKPSAPAKPKSSTSKEEDVESSDDSEEIESSDSEVECTGRRCKTGKSSSSRSSGGNSGGATLVLLAPALTTSPVPVATSLSLALAPATFPVPVPLSLSLPLALAGLYAAVLCMTPKRNGAVRLITR